MSEIDNLLKKAVELKASDIHLKVGLPPILRVDGELKPFGKERISRELGLKLATSVMKPAQWENFKRKNDIDFAYSVPGLGRFRCNAFVQRGTVGMVFRAIPTQIPGIDDLMLPAILKKICMEKRGLVLVTGTTGSGKSTTLASMIDYINASKTVHIMTIEDPVEFLHRDRKGIVNQREVGNDTETFAKALRSALRQDPDVILVGEMRDFETISTALSAAETGHLVFSTLHTLDAQETIGRIISAFPPYQHKQVRIQLASIVRGIISQRLVPRSDGEGRVPAVEVMVSTGLIRDCINDPEKTKMLRDAIAAGKQQYGMQTFDQSLYDLHRSNLITVEEALRWASNPEDFKLKLKGISSSSDMAGDESDEQGGGGGGESGGGGGGMQVERF